MQDYDNICTIYTNNRSYFKKHCTSVIIQYISRLHTANLSRFSHCLTGFFANKLMIFQCNMMFFIVHFFFVSLSLRFSESSTTSWVPIGTVSPNVEAERKPDQPTSSVTLNTDATVFITLDGMAPSVPSKGFKGIPADVSRDSYDNYYGGDTLAEVHQASVFSSSWPDLQVASIRALTARNLPLSAITLTRWGPPQANWTNTSGLICLMMRRTRNSEGSAVLQINRTSLTIEKPDTWRRSLDAWTRTCRMSLQSLRML